jgi:hypothetical protein
MSKISVTLPQFAAETRSDGRPVMRSYDPQVDGLKAIHPSYVLPIQGLQSEDGLQVVIKVVPGTNGGCWTAIELWRQGMSRPASMSLQQLQDFSRVLFLEIGDDATGEAIPLAAWLVQKMTKAQSAGSSFVRSQAAAAANGQAPTATP